MKFSEKRYTRKNYFFIHKNFKLHSRTFFARHKIVVCIESFWHTAHFETHNACPPYHSNSNKSKVYRRPCLANGKGISSCSIILWTHHFYPVFSEVAVDATIFCF